MFSSMFVLAFALSAQPPALGQPEPIPLPPPVIMTIPFDPTKVDFYRTSMYDRWQLYGVDRTNHFRARVVLDFPEPYYLGTGQPFPYLPVRQREYIPYVTH